MERHRQRPARPQAAPGADRARDRAGRHLRHRDVGPHRHAEPHVRHADRHRLPAHQLPGPRQGGVQQRHCCRGQRRRRPQTAPGIDRRGGASPAGRRLRGRVRRRLRAVRVGRQRDRHRRLGTGLLLRPQPPSLVGAARRRAAPPPPPTTWSWTKGRRRSTTSRSASGSASSRTSRRRRSRSPASSPSAPPTTSPGATLAGFYLPTAQALFNTRGHYDTINVLAKPGADNVQLQRAIAEAPAAGRRGGQRPNGRQRAVERRQQRTLVPLRRRCWCSP